VAHTVAVPGTSFVLNANASNYASIFVILKPFHERQDVSLSGDAIIANLRARVRKEVPDARVLVFGAPAVRGLGNAGGFKLMVEATSDVDYDALGARADELVAQGAHQPGIAALFGGFRPRTPQLYVDIDRTKAKTMGVPLTAVFDALQAYLGSYYVNDFNRFGRTWQVNVQADAPFRLDAETIRQLKVRNSDGDVVPLGAVAEVQDSTGPVQITRYNMFPAAPINGAALPGAGADPLGVVDGIDGGLVAEALEIEADVGGADDDEPVVIEGRHFDAAVDLLEDLAIREEEPVDHFVVEPLVLEHEAHLAREGTEPVVVETNHAVLVAER
jgi:multidrug efflux pump